MAKARKPTEPMVIRTGIQRASVYNEGNHVFLYDDSSVTALRDADAYWVLLTGEIESQEKRIKALHKQRMIVVYELIQDDEIDVAVAVGEPLTSNEKSLAAWYKPQKAVLNLPTGRLRIETADSCRFADEPAHEEGATLTVPPGEYVLTLHRMNWNELDVSKEDRPDLPTELITLTPTTQIKAPSKAPLILTLGDLFGEKALWETKGKAVDGEFHGTVKEGLLTLVTNLTPKLVAHLGWRWGMRLQVETDLWQAEVLFLHSCNLNFTKLTHGEQVQDWVKSVPLVTAPTYANTPGLTLIDLIPTTKPTADSPSPYKSNKDGMPIRIRALPNPVATLPAPSMLKDYSFDGTRLHGRVLSCSKSSLTLNLTWPILKQGGIGFDDRLMLTAGQSQRYVMSGQDSDARHHRAAARDELLRKIPGGEDLIARMKKLDEDSQGRGAPFPSLEKMRLEVLDIVVPPELAATVPLSVMQYPHWEAPGGAIFCLIPIVGRIIHPNLPPGSPVTVQRCD